MESCCILLNLFRELLSTIDFVFANSKNPTKYPIQKYVCRCLTRQRIKQRYMYIHTVPNQIQSLSYVASAVKYSNATNSVVHFINQNMYFLSVNYQTNVKFSNVAIEFVDKLTYLCTYIHGSKPRISELHANTYNAGVVLGNSDF